LSSHPRQRKGKQGGRAREKERESERVSERVRGRGSVTQTGSQGQVSPAWDAVCRECPTV
jgi:hypothetical protein